MTPEILFLRIIATVISVVALIFCVFIFLTIKKSTARTKQLRNEMLTIQNELLTAMRDNEIPMRLRTPGERDAIAICNVIDEIQRHKFVMADKARVIKILVEFPGPDLSAAIAESRAFYELILQENAAADMKISNLKKLLLIG